MKKITWIRLSSKFRYGGGAFGQKARESLAGRFEIEVKDLSPKTWSWKYLKPFFWFSRLLALRGQSHLWVRDDLFSLAALPFSRPRGKNLAVIYHIDSSVFPLLLRLPFFLLEKMAYWGLRKTDAILTISEYWQNYFLKKGYKNVFKIYPAFDLLSDFNVSESETAAFKKKYGLEEKPIVYLGNCQKAKGVVEAREALQGLDVYFVTSGQPQVIIDALNFNLDYADYLKMLKAASLVITMSKFKEGWNMTAHEAMLLKTPVIGSGSGGMKELLEGGKQIICQDFNFLREKVEYLLKNPGVRKEMGENGFAFAKNFTLERFREDWLKLAENVIK